jgi:hypothetical protein
MGTTTAVVATATVLVSPETFGTFWRSAPNLTHLSPSGAKILATKQNLPYFPNMAVAAKFSGLLLRLIRPWA